MDYFLVSHLCIPRYTIANRIAEQTAEYKRRHGSFSKQPRRVSTKVDTGHYVEDEPKEYEEELQLRVDSFDKPQV